jgi:hypothetical protein
VKTPGSSPFVVAEPSGVVSPMTPVVAPAGTRIETLVDETPTICAVTPPIFAEEVPPSVVP